MIAGGNLFAAYPLFQHLTADVRTAESTKFGQRSNVQSEVAYFRDKIAKVATPADFLKDYRLLKFALSAYSMESQIEYPARIKQILLSDPADGASLVNRMSDPSYRTINADFDFTGSGVSKLQDPAFVDTLVKKYVDSQYEASLGELNSALPDALYFQRKIAKVTNGYEIIGDPVLFDVVKTVLNIPNSAVIGSIESVKRWIEKDLDFSRLGDANYIQGLLKRHLVLKDVQAQQSTSNPLLDIFA